MTKPLEHEQSIHATFQFQTLIFSRIVFSAPDSIPTPQSAVPYSLRAGIAPTAALTEISLVQNLPCIHQGPFPRLHLHHVDQNFHASLRYRVLELCGRKLIAVAVEMATDKLDALIRETHLEIPTNNLCGRFALRLAFVRNSRVCGCACWCLVWGYKEAGMVLGFFFVAVIYYCFFFRRGYSSSFFPSLGHDKQELELKAFYLSTNCVG